MIKTIFYLSVVLFAFACCTKSNETSAAVLNETIPADTTSVAIVTGAFVNGPHGTVTGTATVYLQSGKYILALENAAISNGPDLHVYLSKEIQPLNFIDLGKLQSTAGNQLYSISGKPNFSEYKYALIHCQQYNHLFGSAALK